MIKANISYETEQERRRIEKFIKPIRKYFLVKTVTKNKYKHVYLQEKQYIETQKALEK